MKTVHVGLDSWIIQDGNYGDFEVGGQHRFALEFYPHELTPELVPGAPKPLLQHDVGGLHDVRGTIVRATQTHWVIDFGALAFQDAAPPPWAKAGGHVHGVAYIGIDPFFYFERLQDETGMPDLFRSWMIRRILIETTPWIESERLVTRANVARSFAEVPRTDAWNDDEGRAHYVLECELQEPAN